MGPLFFLMGISFLVFRKNTVNLVYITGKICIRTEVNFHKYARKFSHAWKYNYTRMEELLTVCENLVTHVRRLGSRRT